MMNTFKKLYRDFFGLTEQTAMSTKADPSKDVVLSPIDAKDPKKVQAAQNILKTTKGRIHIEEELVDEAKLVNGIDEYRGGVEYAIKDATIAKQVSDDIRQWAEKKGFTIIKRTVSKNGKNGYFYFRLSDDPAKDAQRIQGYFAQRMELSAFRFRVRGESKPKPTPNPQVPIRKI
jgi:hypothetical protein